MYSTSQKLIAEFLGTFALVFFGAGAICTDQYLHGGGLGLLGIALAHGLAFAIMVSALGHISGGHFNPAVTIGFWVTKRVSTIDVFLYWAAQLVGAIAAAFVLKAIMPEDTWRAVALGTPEMIRDLPRISAMILEALATFFFVLVFFSVFGAAAAFATGSGMPARFWPAIVFMRAMSRRMTRTREVFSSWPVARWKRRLNCSFLSLSTSSSS